jgi:hypothetical protein
MNDTVIKAILKINSNAEVSVKVIIILIKLLGTMEQHLYLKLT